MNDKSFGAIVREARQDFGWSQEMLAERSGLSQATISRIEADSQANLTEASKEGLLRALGIEGAAPVPEIHIRPIPVISWVRAGEFTEAVDQWPVGVSGESESVFSRRKVGPHAFGLRIEGNSMAPRYLPGDTIIVDPEIRYDNGSACVVWINGEVSLKLFYEDEKEIRLVPTNETHEIRTIPKDRKVDFRVIGKVVDMIPKL